MNNFAYNLKKRRLELGLSQDDLALMLGYRTRSSINKIEKGLNDIPRAKLEDFARALQVPPATLLGWSSESEESRGESNALQTTVTALIDDSDDDGSEGYNLEILAKRLRENEFDAEVFSTAAEAIDYIGSRCFGKSVGLGDTIVRRQLGLERKLEKTNELHLTDVRGYRDSGKKAIISDVFILAANAISYQSGEMVNVSIRGSRIAGSLYYADEVIFVVGKDVIVPTLTDAIHRAKYVYIPKACMENKLRTPCAQTGKCEAECRCPDRACRTTCIYHNPPKSVHTTVLLLNENLGW